MQSGASRQAGAKAEPIDTIGQRIRASRKRRGLNQGALAERLGVTQPTVANWEAGVHDPRQLMLAKLAEALGVTLGWLAGGERAPTEAQGEAAAAYLRRPLRHVPVLTPDAAMRVSLGSLDPHEAATDYVPVTYGGGRLAAVFTPGYAVADEVGADALLVVDYDRRSPTPGDLVLLADADGLRAVTWPQGGRRDRVCGTVVASVRFH